MSRLLALIFIAGLFLRLFQLGIHPLNLNRDELAIGYNAYSLVKTAHDEHGQGPWPLIFQSFGDYKLPGLIYLAYLPVKWLGLNAFALRIPTALIGSSLIIIVYFLAKEIFKKKSAGIIAALFIAFSYWHLYGSRSAYEPIAALSFSALGFLFLLWSRRRPIWLLFSVLAMIISFFIYNSPLIIGPLVFAAYLFWNRRDYQKQRLWLVSCAVILLVAIGFFIRLTAVISQAKSHATIFTQPELIYSINQNTHYLNSAGFPLPIARIFSNKPLAALFVLAKNYLSSFDFTYLFVAGDDNPWHSLRNINLGNFNLVLLSLFLVGIYQLIRRRDKTTNKKFLLLLLLIPPLPNAISVNAPVTNRLMDFHLAITLISVYGFLVLTKRMRVLTLLAYLALAGYFLISYWFIFPYRLAPLWNDQAGRLMQDVWSVKDQYDHIYITPELDFGYVYFVFYNRYDPTLFQKRSEWVKDPLARVVSLESGKYIFDMIDLDQVVKRHQPGEKLLMVNRGTRVIAEKPAVVLTIKDINEKILWQAEEIIVPKPVKL